MKIHGRPLGRLRREPVGCCYTATLLRGTLGLPFMSPRHVGCAALGEPWMITKLHGQSGIGRFSTRLNRSRWAATNCLSHAAAIGTQQRSWIHREDIQLRNHECSFSQISQLRSFTPTGAWGCRCSTVKLQLWSFVSATPSGPGESSQTSWNRPVWRHALWNLFEKEGRINSGLGDMPICSDR